MKRMISIGAIAIVALALISALSMGIYNTATGHYMLRAGGSGQHQGWNAADDAGRGQSQGRRWPENETQSESRQGADPTTDDVVRASSDSWVTHEGTLVELEPEPVLQTDDGQGIQLGMGPSSYRESLQVVLSVGDEVVVTGFYEGSEFKVRDLTNHATGQRTVLRDDTGRPMWAGQGRRRNT